MRAAAVTQKELRATFNSPVAYIVVVLLLLVPAIWFFEIEDFAGSDVASLRDYFAVMPILLAVVVPALTMRTWAEERRSGTDEVLLTLPLSGRDLVLGKYFAGLLTVLLAIVLSGAVPWTVAPLGDFDQGEILGQYVGLLLLSSATLAIGQFVSSLSRNQISSFLMTGLILLALALSGPFANAVLLPSWVADPLRYVSLDAHYRNFTRGILDTRDLVYFVGLTALFLYATTRVLLRRRRR